MRGTMIEWASSGKSAARVQSVLGNCRSRWCFEFFAKYILLFHAFELTKFQITFERKRIWTEHVYTENSFDSTLQIEYICSIRNINISGKNWPNFDHRHSGLNELLNVFSRLSMRLGRLTMIIPNVLPNCVVCLALLGSLTPHGRSP